MIGAEVEHCGNRSGGRQGPPPIGSAVEGFPRRTPPRGVSHSAAPDRGRSGTYSSGGGEFLLALRRLSPPNRKISEFSTSLSAMAVAMVVLNRMLPQSENGVLVVMMIERFCECRVEMT